MLYLLSIHTDHNTIDLHYLSRPELIRKSSSGVIVLRDDPQVVIQEDEEIFDPDDARAMSPRRNSEDLEMMFVVHAPAEFSR